MLAKQQVPRFERFPEVSSRVGLSRATIWRLEREGKFPRRRRISGNAVAWLNTEIDDWMSSREGASDDASGDAA